MSYLDALRIEREGYVTRGLTDRVKQVDGEIKRVEKLAAEAEPEVETAEDQMVGVETADASPRRGRRS